MARTFYKKVLAMPDGVEKLAKLDLELLKLQHHGQQFAEAKAERARLWEIYKDEYMDRIRRGQR